MSRPTRLEILEYALTGVYTDIGTSLPATSEDFDWLDEAERHRDWLIAEIARIKANR